MPHPSEHRDADQPLGRDEAEELAEAMRAFGSASRLMLLWELLDGERTVEHLADAIGMEHSAVSQQLRLLRALRLVAVRRSGRHAHYRLHDHHLPELMAAIRHHREHVEVSRPVLGPALSAASESAAGAARSPRPTRSRAPSRRSRAPG